MRAPVLRGSTERLVIAGTMGPTIHRVPAWRLTAADGRVEVHADPARFRAMDDPSGRGLHLSCGTVLVNLRLAAAQLGREAVIRQRPDADRPTLLASARLTRRRRVTREERLLYAATMRPAPARGAVAGRDAAPDARLVGELAEFARLEGTTMHVLPGGGRRAVLTTEGDSPGAWMRAGRALQSVLLAATLRGVGVSFLYEVVDVPPVGAPGDVPQVLLELSAQPVDRQHERQRHRERVG